MAPHFKILGGQKKKKKVDGSFTWFETGVNGGAIVLALLRDAATFAPLPYMRAAASSTLTIIMIAQTVKDNRNDFRRLCEDAAGLTCAVYESRQQSEDPDNWPGAGLQDAVNNFLLTLNKIEEFATAQLERGRIIRVMNSVGDSNKIREFRERLAQAMSRFEVSAHLQSYEVLRLIKNMMENYKNRLNEQDDVEGESARPLPPLPDPESEANPDEQLLRDEELAQVLSAEEQRRAEGRTTDEEEVRRREKDEKIKTVDDKLQQILLMLESRPEPESSRGSKAKESSDSSGDERIIAMAMKDAADKRADRAARRKDFPVDEILAGRLGGLNLGDSPRNYDSGAHGRRGPTRVINKNSGNENTHTVYGSHNDNSTVTRIIK